MNQSGSFLDWFNQYSYSTVQYQALYCRVQLYLVATVLALFRIIFQMEAWLVLSAGMQCVRPTKRGTWCTMYMVLCTIIRGGSWRFKSEIRAFHLPTETFKNSKSRTQTTTNTKIAFRGIILRSSNSRWAISCSLFCGLCSLSLLHGQFPDSAAASGYFSRYVHDNRLRQYIHFGSIRPLTYSCCSNSHLKPA